MLPAAVALACTQWMLAAPALGHPDLVAIAAASPRPRVCAAAPSGATTAVWSRARGMADAAPCAALARGYARLPRQPAQALKLAEATGQAWPDQAAPLVLAARALVALERPAEAAAHFQRALGLDARSVEAPEALHDLALAALRVGELEVARRAYRALVPRIGLLADDERAQRVLIEAAAVVMTEGVGALDEAASYLGEARAHARVPGPRLLVIGLLALTLSRAGRAEPSRGVVAEADGLLLATDPEPSPGAAPGARRDPALPPGELHAIAAMLAEREAREEALDRWRAYLAMAGEKGVWSEHARQRLAALEGGR